MNTSVRLRLLCENDLLRSALPRLDRFVSPIESIGEPPVVHRLRVLPFGLRVRVDDAPKPVPFDPAVHGEMELVLATDPERHPWQPWTVTLVHAPSLAVLSPHVGGRAGARGVVCWIEANSLFVPSNWPASAVLGHVLGMLAGEVFALEGHALQEEAKVWFAAHRDELPFAHVPHLPPPAHGPFAEAAPSAIDEAVESVLGIEFDDVGGAEPAAASHGEGGPR